MKKFASPAISVAFMLAVAVIITSLFFLPQHSSSSLAKTENSSLLQTFVTTPKKLLVAQLNPADVSILKKYAESYEPKSTKRQTIPDPPEPNEKVLQAISNLANSQSREYEKYIVLIFLRLYRFHIENFSQSYELGREGLLRKEYFRIVGVNDYQKAEFISSGLAHTFVEKNPEFLKYSLIEKEMKRIEKAGEKIKKELDETMREQEKSIR